jgi:hypothetical protein
LLTIATGLAALMLDAAPPTSVPVAWGKPDRDKHPGQNGELTQEQDALARAAWKYFENNHQPTTCLYNSVDGYPSTTMWDTASAIAALVSAYELNLIFSQDFDQRMGCLLDSLYRMELYNDEAPNKAYHTASLEMVNYDNTPGEIGISALDLGRLLTWLAIVKTRYPIHAEKADKVVLRWKFCNLVDRAGTLYGAANTPDGGITYLQEGRLGYEEYGAAGFQLWGFDTRAASDPEPYSQIGIHGVPIAYDARDPARFGAHNYVVTEAFLLGGIEFNWDRANDTNPDDNYISDRMAWTFAKRAYKAQFRRWKSTGILTARTEHQIDGPPYFVYDTIYSDGKKWTTIADDGTEYPDLAAVSTKAAIGMWVLFDTPYTEELAAAVMPLMDPAKGLAEGFYEKDARPIATYTANTNGIVLETLLYKQQGKLLADQRPATLWTQVPNGEFSGNDQCLPRKPVLP